MKITRTLIAFLILIIGANAFAQTTKTWSGASSGAWLTAGNWSALPGVFNTPTSNNDIAYFNNNTQPTVGINMNNGSPKGIYYLGAIYFGMGAITARTINNSAGSQAGIIYLNGVTLNSINNTIILNQSSGTHTITNGTPALGIGLNNSTDNVIQVTGTGGLTIVSVLSSTGNLTKAGSGILTLSGANTYSGNTTISAGTLALSVSGSIASSPIITVGSGGTFDVTALTTALSLGASQKLSGSATGSNTTGTISVASGKGITLSAGGLSFSAYGGGSTAPLTVTGASAGALALNSAPVTITTTSALGVGTYTLIAKGGSATGVTGTPGTLTVNGSGLASGTTGALSVVSGQLILTVTTTGYTVTFDANGGTGSMSNQTASTATALTANAYTRTGYAFSGWNTAANGSGTSYTNGQSYPFTANATLYAQWTPNNNTITFDGNGFTGGSTSSQTLATAATAALNTNGYTRTGYTFSGWATTAGGAVAYADGASYTMGTANVTLYAQWTLVGSYTVTFNSNGGSGTMSNQTASTATALTTNSFTRSGYTFTGWNTIAGGGGTAYADGASYPFTASNTLYAQWTINAITLSPTTQAKGPFCNSTTSNVSLIFTSTGTITTPLFIELSDNTGTFPGTSLTGTIISGNITSGTVQATIPSGQGVGNYKIRIKSSDGTPVYSAANNTTNFVIDNPIVINAQPTAPSTACGSFSSSITGLTLTSGSNPTYNWQSSANGTSGWNTVATNDANTGVSYTNGAVALAISGLTTTYYYRCVISNTGCGSTTTSPATTVTVTPTPLQASSLSTNTPTTDGFSASWIAGGGSGTMLVVRATANSNTLPSSGSSYTPNLAWASAGQIDVNNRVVFRTAGTSAGPITGLTAETQYTITSYSYDATGNCYNTSTPVSATQYTLSTEPGAHPASFSATACSNTAITLNFTAASSITNCDGYIILRRQDGANPTITNINDGTAPVSLSLPSGTTLVTTIASTSSTSFSDAVSAGGNYNYLIIPYNANATAVAQTYNYRISGSPLTTSATAGNASTVSDIIVDPTFTYNSDILYSSYQGNPITNTSNSIGVFGLRLRDGGGTSDADVLATTLTGITFTVNSVAQTSVRRYALFQGNTFITEIANPGTTTVAFSGLSISAADNSNADFTLRVSFNNTAATITDNTQMTFSVANATTVSSCATLSSQFTAFTTVSSSTTGTRNQIEVTATKLAFNQGPTSTSNGATMSPSVTVIGQDANNNVDLDFSAAVTLVCSTPAALTSGAGPVTASGGSATFSGVVHGTDGTYTLTATASGYTTTPTSSSYVISSFTNGDYRINPALSSSASVYFSSTTAIGGIYPWQVWSSGAWTDVTGPSTTFAPDTMAIKPPNIYITNGAYVDAGKGGIFNNIIVNFPSSTGTFYSGNTSRGIIIATGKTLDIKVGYFDVPGRLELQGTASLIVRSNAYLWFDAAFSGIFVRSSNSTFEVEDNAVVEIDKYMTNHSTAGIWYGNENFHSASQFYVTKWDNTDNFFSSALPITTTTVGSYSAMFGNLWFDIGSSGITGNWTGVFPSGTVGLTHGDLEIDNNNSNNISLWNGATSAYTIGRDLLTAGTSNIQVKVGAGGCLLTVKRNFTHSGAGDFRLHSYSSAATDSSILYVNGDMSITGGTFAMQTTSASSSPTRVWLSGSLTKGSGAYMTWNPNATGYLNDSYNFIGTGATQSVDVLPHVSNDMLRYRFFVKNGAYVKTKNQNWQFADQAALTVESGATMDFGFNSSGTTALNLTETTSSATTSFIMSGAAKIKITNPNGIDATATAALDGNVQLDTRTYSTTGIYHYIGKTPSQRLGDGINFGGSSGKYVIVELDALSTALVFEGNSGSSTSTFTGLGNVGLSSSGSGLKIIQGTVVATPTTGDFTSTGNIEMTGGLYQISIPASTSVVPQMTGTYTLTGGTVELNGSAAQTLRGGNSPNTPNYYNLKMSGANTVKINNTPIIVKRNLELSNASTTFDVEDNSMTGNAGITMSAGLLRLSQKNTTLPALAGTATPYSLTGGTVEWYGTSSSQTHSLRGTDGNSANINYFNVDINSTGANVAALGANVVAGAGFGVVGTMNVNSPACFQLGSGFTITDAGTSTFEVKPGATFKYGGSIATSGASGNVRTDTRTFPTTASYGFVGSVTPQDPGTGLPSSMVNMYVDKSDTGKLVTITKSEEVTNTLSFYKGIVKTNSDTLYVSNTSTTAITGGNTSGSDKYVQGRLKRKTDGASTYTFPIGHSTQNAQGFTITPTGTSGSDLLGYLETNSTTPVKTVAYCDLETKTAVGQQIGQGTAGADGALDQIVFNLASPLQWDITNPGGGVSSYNVTVLGNGGQDISPVTSAGGTAVRYLLKNGEPGNTGFATGSGGADYPTVGFLACPNQYTLTGMTSFSKFTLNGANPSGTGLPVKLLFFTGRKVENYSQLDWATAIEIDNDKFIVERSADAIQFEAIGSVKGAGNTTVQQNYQWLDKSPLSGWNYYRLKQVDFDGDVEYTNTVAVNFDGDETTPSIIVFPSPSKDFINVQILGTNQIVEAVLYNMIGQAVKNVTPNERMSIEDLPSGEYFIKVIMGNNVVVKQFVKE